MKPVGIVRDLAVPTIPTTYMDPAVLQRIPLVLK